MPCSSPLQSAMRTRAVGGELQVECFQDAHDFDHDGAACWRYRWRRCQNAHESEVGADRSEFHPFSRTSWDFADDIDSVYWLAAEGIGFESDAGSAPPGP